MSNQNAATWFVESHLREGRASKIAFREVDGAERTLTYGDLATQSAHFAGGLARAGVRREERIALLVRDQIEFPIAFWGALKAGVLPIPLNTLLSSSVYETIQLDSRATMLIVSRTLWDVVKPAVSACQCLETIVVIGDAPAGTQSYEVFLKDAEALPAVEASRDETAFWLYSSGSTGMPKGVRHVHSGLRATVDTFGTEVLQISENDVVYSVAKLFFAYGFGNGISFPMAVGATALLLAGRPLPDITFDIIENHAPTILCGVPTLFAAMNASLDSTGRVLESNLRLCTSAGEALPRDVGETWQRHLGAEIVDGVGSTEMLHIFLSNWPGDIVYGTSGRAVPGYDVRLVDKADNDVAAGGIGELLVRGPYSAEGYWNRREESQATFQGSWTRTGDKYEFLEDGRYIYCGRADDMSKVSGIWVSLFEIEQTLVEHPAVLEAAVVAHEDAKGLVKPKAFIVLCDGEALDAIGNLKDFVKEKIGMWKYPRWVDVVDDLPKTATGKIQRFKLRSVA